MNRSLIALAVALIGCTTTPTPAPCSAEAGLFDNTLDYSTSTCSDKLLATLEAVANDINRWDGSYPCNRGVYESQSFEVELGDEGGSCDMVIATLLEAKDGDHINVTHTFTFFEPGDNRGTCDIDPCSATVSLKATRKP